MTTYISERDTYNLLKSIFETQWDDYSGNVKLPTFLLVVSSPARFDMNFEGSVVIIRAAPSGEIETYRDQYKYVDRNYDFVLEIYSKISRQNLLDIKKELRRIIHKNMHRPDLMSWQLIRYKSFIEDTEDTLNIWKGRCFLSCEDNRVAMEV